MDLRDQAAFELAERLKLFIFAWNRPITRLSRDVAGIERFVEMKSPLTPQLLLACAAPPLKPLAAEIVEAVVRIWGTDLVTTKPGRLMTATLAVLGPIAGAEAFVLSMTDDITNDRLHKTGTAFEGVFARHPNAFLARVRDLLAPFGAAGRSTQIP